MFKIDDDLTINLTRGDTAIIGITAQSDNGNNYVFNEGDIVRFSVYEKGNYNNLKLRKEVTAAGQEEELILILMDDDTRLDELINKVKNYWYEIELISQGATQTIIGYDEDGAKLFKLYPEGVDNNDNE